jgi:hypothetical protein
MGKKPWHFLIAAIVTIGCAARAANATDFHDATDGFTVSVPDDWVQIPPEQIQRAAAEITPDGQPELVQIKTGYQQKNTDTEWFSYPYILIEYMPDSGNAPPNDYQIAQFAQNAAGASIDAVDCDYARHTVHTIRHINVDTWGLVKVSTYYIFGSKGTVMIKGLDTDDRFDAELPMFKKVRDSLRLDPRFAYGTNAIRPPTPTPTFDVTDLANSIEACSLVVLVGSVIGITALVTRLNRKREQARLGPIPAEPLEPPPPPLPPR